MLNGPQFFSAIENGITTLLLTHEPAFLRFGQSLFLSLATIVIAWQGMTTMFSAEGLNDRLFAFAKTLLFVSLGYALITYYESPIPGIGSSFSNLVTDQTAYFANVLDAGSVKNVFQHLDDMWAKFVAPGALEVTAGLIYFVLLIALSLAKALSLAVVSFGLIASAVCALLGPLFVPFFIVPKLDFLFWGWFKAFVQYSFIPVVAYAYLMIFEQFLFQVMNTLPAGITPNLYLLYGVEVLVIVATFIVGILHIPSLTSSIFSGSGGQSALDRLRVKGVR